MRNGDGLTQHGGAAGEMGRWAQRAAKSVDGQSGARTPVTILTRSKTVSRLTLQRCPTSSTAAEVAGCSEHRQFLLNGGEMAQES